MITILIVDDNIAQLDIYSMFFKLVGYDVITATNGTDALSIAQSRPIDVLLTDYVMPGRFRSVDLANAVRKMRPRSVVVFMSGYDIALDADSLGAYITLLKPFDLKSVDTMIKDELKRFTTG